MRVAPVGHDRLRCHGTRQIHEGHQAFPMPNAWTTNAISSVDLWVFFPTARERELVGSPGQSREEDMPSSTQRRSQAKWAWHAMARRQQTGTRRQIQEGGRNCAPLAREAPLRRKVHPEIWTQDPESRLGFAVVGRVDASGASCFAWPRFVFSCRVKFALLRGCVFGFALVSPSSSPSPFVGASASASSSALSAFSSTPFSHV